MRNKLIYCIPLALSITCLIGCAAKAAQMPAEPEPVALLPEQKQSSIVTNDAKNETIPTPQQSEHEDTPVRIVESTPADTPANADTEVPQAAPVPTTQPNVTEDIPSETVHAKTGYVEPEPTPEPELTPEPGTPADRQAAIDAANAYAVTQYGVTTDSSLTLDNSACRFPAAVPVDASQATLEAKARDMVDFTFRQIMMQVGRDSVADAGFHCNVCIVEDGGSLLIYVLYD